MCEHIPNIARTELAKISGGRGGFNSFVNFLQIGVRKTYFILGCASSQKFFQSILNIKHSYNYFYRPIDPKAISSSIMINEKDASLEAQVPLIHSNKTSFESSGHCSSLVDHDSSYEQKALLRKLFAYSMVILPWLLLLIVGFSKLISLKEPQSTGYCNPDLFYSTYSQVQVVFFR